jgi:hypothetical protein
MVRRVIPSSTLIDPLFIHLKCVLVICIELFRRRSFSIPLRNTGPGTSPYRDAKQEFNQVIRRCYSVDIFDHFSRSKELPSSNSLPTSLSSCGVLYLTCSTWFACRVIKFCHDKVLI